MSWIRIWVHLVFSTINRQPLINSNTLRKQIFEHIKANAKEKNIWLDMIGGYYDHIHCLISMGKDQSISKIAQLIKGESSCWINKFNLLNCTFAWQDDYWAVSVSESQLDHIRNYIMNQELHHGHLSFSNEIEVFMEKYGADHIGLKPGK